MIDAAGPLARLQLPIDLKLDWANQVLSETNSVYFCRGRLRGSGVEGYLKVADRRVQSLENERAILERIRTTAIPVPETLAFGGDPKPFLFLAKLPGKMLWDLVDPRRSGFEKGTVTRNLEQYGATLAQIHALEIAWSDQPRAWLEGLVADEEGKDPRAREIVAWLRATRPAQTERVFVHGDFNTANVLLDRGRVAGVIDWEFAGVGWKEYELAWALRARVHFLNSAAERDAILSGYERYGCFDEAHLRWCEVLNYLHFASWAAESDSSYREFALTRAESAVVGSI